MRKKAIDHAQPIPAPAPAATDTGVFFTIPELARRWRVDRHTVSAAIKAGRLRAFKPDKRVYRISEREVRRYESEQDMAVAS